jgi:hypothetical protein
MQASEIDRIVRSQIGDAWETYNLHGVDLRKTVAPATRAKVIERTVVDGQTRDRLLDVWMVLVEDSERHAGYRIVASSDGRFFGLATKGLPADEHPVLCGWYGDFLTTFRAM